MTDQNKVKDKFDLVYDILETIRIRGTIFYHSNLAAPWGMKLELMDVPRFHIALTGKFFVGVDHNQSLSVQSMEIVMLPTGTPHWIADIPGRDLIDSRVAGEACELDNPYFQNGELTHSLMCGVVNFDKQSSHPILDTLPDILHFPHDRIDQSAWATALLIDNEIRRIGSNSSPIIDRLTEVLFLQLIEDYINNHHHENGFIAALSDQRLRHALDLIHHYPEKNWSLESLGKAIGMSRATLNRHFQNTLDTTPIAYMQNWKMIKAYNLISYSNFSMEQIAEKVGFTSARTLSKAFHKRYNRTPSQVRSSAPGSR